MAPKQVDNYSIDKYVGRGSYGELWRGRAARGGEVAVRVVRRQTPADVDALRAEVQILRRLSHENVVRLVDLKKTASRFYLVLEACAATGDLRQLLRSLRGGPLPEATAWDFLAQIAAGLQALHDLVGCPHADLHPGSILIHRGAAPASTLPGGRVVLKLANFGRRAAPGSRYAAPEVSCSETPGVEVDQWSLGVIFFEMLSGTCPAPGAGDLALAPAPAAPRATVGCTGLWASSCPSGRTTPLLQLGTGWWQRRGDLELGVAGSLPPESCALLAALLAHQPGERPTSGEVRRLASARLAALSPPPAQAPPPLAASAAARWSLQVHWSLPSGAAVAADLPPIPEVDHEDAVGQATPASRAAEHGGSLAGLPWAAATRRGHAGPLPPWPWGSAGPGNWQAPPASGSRWWGLASACREAAHGFLVAQVWGPPVGCPLARGGEGRHRAALPQSAALPMGPGNWGRGPVTAFCLGQLRASHLFRLRTARLWPRVLYSF